MLAAFAILTAVTGQPIAPLPCRILLAPKRAGEAVFAADAIPSACPAKQPQALLRYDRRRALVVARSELAAGTELGRAWLPERPAVSAGQVVSITAGLGHVVISRQAQALQPAQPGQRFFVRTDDGAIFAAPAVPSSAKQQTGAVR